MSNIIYEHKLFNKETKEEYLSELTTKSPIERIFKVSASLEEFYQKDLYNFNREELRRLFFLLNPLRFNAIRNYANNISSYIDWAIAKGLRKSINPLLSIDKEWYEQFVSKAKKYFTEEELEYFISKCRNAQDAVIIRLRMEGVGGSGNSELLNLKIGDVDEKKNTLKLTDKDGQVRFLKVSDKCISLCLAAHRQTTYLKKNGAYKKESKSTITNLVENDYILRSSITKTENFQEAEKFLVHRRLKVLADYFEEPYLSPTNISFSGMLMMAKKFFDAKGKLEKSDYIAILETFGYRNTDHKGVQNYYRLREDFLNEETLKKLYKL